MIIGISGKKRSGKDTVFSMIDAITAHEVRTTRTAFGDQIKQEIAESMNITVGDIDADKERFRPLLQWWGAEFRRGYCGDDYWIKKMRLAAATWYARDWLIITDVRFPNEAELVRELDGVLIRVERDTGLDDTHDSETALDDYDHFDFRFKNDGSLDDLETAVIGIVSEIYNREPTTPP
jgi:hypothetical protein